MKKSLLTAFLFLAAIFSCAAQWTGSPGNIYYNTGNVGIGTTTPGNLLEVSGTTASPLTITRTTASSNVSMEFKNGSASWFAGQASNGNFGIATSNNLLLSTIFNVTTGGNVGIGTNTPDNLLEVSGSLPSPLTITRTDAASNISLEFKNASASWFAGQASNGNFGIATSNNLTTSNIFNVTTDGNVGIGTTVPANALSISTTATGRGLDILSGTTTVIGSISQQTIAGSTINMDISGVSGRSLSLNGTVSNNLILNPIGGNVGIGTTAPDQKLSVNGTIHSKSVLVDLNGWSDFVFKPAYYLRPLAEVKTYVEKNHHLPDVPAAAEVEKNGLDIGEMNKILMQKVEELTLYLIDKDKAEQQQKEINKKLLKLITAQQKQINSLKK